MICMILDLGGVWGGRLRVPKTLDLSYLQSFWVVCWGSSTLTLLALWPSNFAVSPSLHLHYGVIVRVLIECRSYRTLHSLKKASSFTGVTIIYAFSETFHFLSFFHHSVLFRQWKSHRPWHKQALCQASSLLAGLIYWSGSRLDKAPLRLSPATLTALRHETPTL